MEQKRDVSTLRIVFAAVLDFFTVFFIGGYVIASLTGNATGEGFQLNGLPALLLFALIIAYFYFLPKTKGGTLWQRILKAKR
ncbi:MAG: hypothetical protein WBD01_04170 [Salaquimonas sp.]